MKNKQPHLLLGVFVTNHILQNVLVFIGVVLEYLKEIFFIYFTFHHQKLPLIRHPNPLHVYLSNINIFSFL